MFRVGELVLLRANPMSSELEGEIKKFFMIYEGPYKVEKICQDDVYILTHPHHGKERGRFHVSSLKPYFGPSGPPQ